MKIQIRRSVFETNSSSTHTLVLLQEADWEKVKAGELFIDVLDAEKMGGILPRLVTEDFLIAEAKEEYLEHERYFGKESHKSFRDGHYISWEEIMKECNGDYAGYNLNIFGWAGEKYINPKSRVWHNHTEENLGDGRVKVNIEHFFG